MASDRNEGRGSERVAGIGRRWKAKVHGLTYVRKLWTPLRAVVNIGDLTSSLNSFLGLSLIKKQRK